MHIFHAKKKNNKIELLEEIIAQKLFLTKMIYLCGQIKIQTYFQKYILAWNEDLSQWANILQTFTLKMQVKFTENVGLFSLSCGNQGKTTMKL